MILEQETFEEYGYYPKDLKQHSRKTVLVACDDCGKIIYRGLHHVQRSKHHFCDIKCYGKWLSRVKSGDKNSFYKGGKVKIDCDNCGNTIEREPAAVKGHEHHFCNRKCFGEWQSKHRKGENNPSWKGGKVKQVCEACGKEFETTSSQIRKGWGKFCSHECFSKWLSTHLKGENAPNWQGGISFEPYCEKFNFAFKEYIREKFGRVCFLCGKTEEENGERLSIHHVNYDKDCLCNDNLTCQFVPLCRSCNAKVNNNREMWEKKIKAKMQNKLNGWYI
ncbi:MAG: hypothetical protein H8D26_04700 [Methanomicrobia archaeon]|nr:hypothetical protein [Methanomicrobia archaeon]